MKASELRIGNYVTTLTGDKVLLPTMITEKIGEIDLFSVELYDYKKSFAEQHPRICNLKYISPIPLTEEWLRRFGFKQRNVGYYFIKDMCLSYANVGLHNYTLRLDGYYIHDIKHVHQLQNLYFALTNTELQCTL